MDEYQEYQLLKTHHYAIVDATLRDEIPPTWEQCVIAPAFLGEDTARCPLLLDLRSVEDAEKEQYFKRLIDETHAIETTWCNLLLASEAPINKIAKHLAQRLVLKLPNEETPKQFRYFDPGTFLQLPAILGDAGIAWLMGPISSIGIPWVGELTQYQKPDAQGRFTMRPTHHDKLLEIGVVNRVLLDRSRSVPADQATWVNRATSIHTYIQRALQNGLNDIDSIVYFCLHALAHHPRFDEHPRLQEIFTTLANATEADELDYRFLTLPLKGEGWQSIVKDLLTQEQAII